MDRIETTTASSTGRPTGRPTVASSGTGSTFRAIARGTSIERRQRTRTTPPAAVRPGAGGPDVASDNLRLAV